MESNGRAWKDRSFPKWGQLPVIMRLHTGAEIIISWEPIIPLKWWQDNNFSISPPRTRTEVMINQARLFLGLFNYAYLSLGSSSS
jgi:hypothetical protein